MDVLATGYPSMDYIIQVTHSPGVGETALIKNSPERFYFGGCGANIAAALAALGHQVGVAMIIGRDRYGDDYVQYLIRRGINISNLIRLPDERTSMSYLFLNSDLQHQNYFLPGAADAWDDTLQLKQISDYRYAVVTVGPLRYNKQFVKLVQEAKVPLIWELKPDIYAYPPETMKDFHEASRYILMNHIEAEYVLKSLGMEKAEQLLNDTTQAVIITNGAQGAKVYTKEGTTEIPIVPAKQVIDPTGAGDGFTAGFISGLLRDMSPVESAKLGASLATFVIEALGCQTNVPTWTDLEARYKEHFVPA